MTKENGKQFVIPSKKLNTIVTTLKTYSVEPIMTGEIVRRCLYKVNNEGPQTDDNYKWLRIMEGDVECDGENRITITYKDKKKDMSGVDSALLTVDNFDDATHLFELLHFEKTSYQENKRFKYRFTVPPEGLEYLIRFDVWPKIEEFVFVTLISKSVIDDDDIDDVIAKLYLEEENICTSEKYDVDKIYKLKFGVPASQIPYIAFEFPLFDKENQELKIAKGYDINGISI